MQSRGGKASPSSVLCLHNGQCPDIWKYEMVDNVSSSTAAPSARKKKIVPFSLQCLESYRFTDTVSA